MDYIESLENGQCIAVSSGYYIVTSDYKTNGNRMCVSLKDGSIRWFDASLLVDAIDIFTFDKDTNIVAIKQREKLNENSITKT